MRDRSLDWGSHPSDILLFPHSPLALAEVLSHPEGRLDLLSLSADRLVEPASTATDVADIRTNVDSLDTKAHTRRSRRRDQRQRMNLLSRLDQNELMDRCRRSLMENALVKRRGLRRFVLVAGFIRERGEDGSELRRAPLLIYPTLLVRKADRNDYEVRFDGSTPELNQKLLEHLRVEYGIALPSENVPRQLPELFAQVAECLGSTDALDLEFDIALGNSTINLGETSLADRLTLPQRPQHFDASLAMRITENTNLMELSAVLQLIPDYNSPAASSSGLPTEGSVFARLQSLAQRLSAVGLDHVEFDRLDTLPSLLTEAIATVQPALDSETVNEVLDAATINVRQLIRLAGSIELIDKSPSTIDTHGHADLCYAHTAELLARARHQANLLEEEMQALQAHFAFERVPPMAQLLDLIDELEASVGLEPGIVEADYFNARRRFMEFSLDKPTQLDREHRRLLAQLAKTLRFRELFVNNTDYRLAFGPAYRGLRTDWDMLAVMSAYARELADVLCSERIAARALGRWPQYRTAFVKDLDHLRKAADALRLLLATLGTHWQKRPVNELITESLRVGQLLEDWQTEFGSMKSHGSRTAARILRGTTGSSDTPIDAAQVEQKLTRTRACIDGTLSAGLTDVRRIDDTLAWLRAASDAAREHAFDVEAIVEQLEIA